MFILKPPPFRRLLYSLTGGLAISLSTWSWIRDHSQLSSVLFLGLGMVLGWAFCSRARANVTLFRKCGVYWDGFTFVTFDRKHVQDFFRDVRSNQLFLSLSGPGSPRMLDLPQLNAEAEAMLLAWIHAPDPEALFDPKLS